MKRKEHALAIVKAGVSGIPILGGPVASLLSDYIPSATQKTVELALKDLEKKLDNLGDRIDYDNVNKEEFSEIFKSSYYTIVRTHQKEKIQAATTLIANALLKNSDIAKLQFVETDHFSRCIEQLSMGALDVLGEATSIVQSLNDCDQSKKIDVRFIQAYQFEFSLLSKRLSNYDPSLLMGLVGELNSCNLIHRKGIPEMPTPDYGNYQLELTRLGLKFVSSLMDENVFN